MTTQYSPLNPTGGSARETAHTVNLLLDGRINSIGSFDAASGATSTTVSDPRLGSDRVVLLMPTSTAAAGATVSVSDKSMVVTYPSALTAAETIKYVVFG